MAASATVSEPSRQIDQIYQRQVVLFPQPGPDLYESFYARLQPPDRGDPARDTSDNAEHRTPTRRRYISLMTNGRTHTAATVAVLSAFHLTISQLMKALIEGDDAARWQAEGSWRMCCRSTFSGRAIASAARPKTCPFPHRLAYRSRPDCAALCDEQKGRRQCQSRATRCDKPRPSARRYR